MQTHFSHRYRWLVGVLALSLVALLSQHSFAQQQRQYQPRSRYDVPNSRFANSRFENSRFENSRFENGPDRSSPSRARSAYAVRPVQFREPVATTQQPRGGQFQQALPQQARPQQAVRQHPLVPAIALAQQALKAMENIQDYECTLVKRHRDLTTGKMRDLQYIYLKVRHKPFSVYMYFLTPAEKKGQQVLYVDGANKDRAGKSTLVAQPVGFKGIAGPYHLDPKGNLAMDGQRYPITDVGFKNLTLRLLEVANNDKQFGECEVKIFDKTMVNRRSTTCIQVYHPVPRNNFRFHIAKIFIDDELGVPIRYEAYMWPKQPGGKPVLDEEYTYLNVKTNCGLTDADFTIRKK